MFGGGTWTSQNKTLPGAYINIVAASRATANVGERGWAALILDLGSENVGKVVTATSAEYIEDNTVFGSGLDEDVQLAINECFANATTLSIYNSNGKTLTEWDTGLAPALAALEPIEFNTLGIPVTGKEILANCTTYVKNWRAAGKKCQIVVQDRMNDMSTRPTSNYEGVINVVNRAVGEEATPSTDPSTTAGELGGKTYALLAWVTGAEAGCDINASVTNKVYDGAININTEYKQSDLEQFMEYGFFVFHTAYNAVRVLEDINSLTEYTEDVSEDFRYNQTIRVCDQIATDIAYLFNTKYLGKIPNDEAGRTSLWADIVKHHRELEDMRAIENFDSSLLTVEQGTSKRSIVVNDAVTVINAMSQLYMTVVVS